MSERHKSGSGGLKSAEVNVQYFTGGFPESLGWGWIKRCGKTPFCDGEAVLAFFNIPANWALLGKWDFGPKVVCQVPTGFPGRC